MFITENGGKVGSVQATCIYLSFSVTIISVASDVPFIVLCGNSSAVSSSSH